MARFRFGGGPFSFLKIVIDFVSTIVHPLVMEYRILLQTSTYRKNSVTTIKFLTKVEYVFADSLWEARCKAIAQTDLKAGISPIEMSMGWPLDCPMAPR